MLKYAIGIGLASGLLVLIRPTNIIALIFPLFLLFSNLNKLESATLIRDFIIAVLLAFTVWIPQLAYWQYTSGQWIYYSYSDEGFFFNDPEIWKGLFSYRKGWFVYSPILWLSIPGFLLLYLKKRKLFFPAIITLFVALWVTFSWWCWWYGGGFGARPLIEFLPFMGLALAALIHWLLIQKNALKIPSLVLMLILCFMSIKMNQQYKEGIIHYDSMSKSLFWKQFLKDHYIHDYSKLLDPPDYQKALINEDD